jgi:hypothetical protein
VSEDRLGRSQRIALVGGGAVISTLVVWYRESDAASSPLITTALFLLIVLGLVLIIRLGRPRAVTDHGDGNGLPHATRAADRRPRPFAQVPRAQRQRLITLVCCAALLFLLVAPLLILGLTHGAPLVQALPMLVILALAVVAVAFVWRQVRYPTAQTLSLEKQPLSHISRRFVPYLIFVPAFALAGLAYQALTWKTPLALTAAFAINLAAAALILIVDERLARKYAGKEPRGDPPVW